MITFSSFHCNKNQTVKSNVLPPLTGWQLSVSAGAVAQIMLEVIGLLVTDLWHTGLVIPFKATVLICEVLEPGVGDGKRKRFSL